MAVYNRQIVIVILLAYKSARILTKCPYFVFKGLGITYELRFVQNTVNKLHNLVTNLDPDADINRAGLVGNVKFGALLFKPVGSAPAGRNYSVLGKALEFLIFIADIRTKTNTVFYYKAITFMREKNLHAIFYKILLNSKIKLLRLFGA